MSSTLDTADGPWVVIRPLYGRVVCESRMRFDGSRIVGEGRALHYDQDGKLEKDTGWQPTGVVLYWHDAEEPRRWWQFWK